MRAGPSLRSGVPPGSRADIGALTLGAPSLRAVNIVERIPLQNGCETTVTMRAVPSFLVSACVLVRDAARSGSEGIFRQESSAVRLRPEVLQPVFLGDVRIPPHFSPDDVATALKRFVRQLETRLLHGAQLERRLDALSNQGDRTDVPLELMRLFAPRVPPGFAKAAQYRRPNFKKWRQRDEGRLLPELHVATLGFLMRKLREIASFAARTRMNTHNLAIVFAPTLFDDPPLKVPAVKELTMRRVRIVEMLITHAQWIGLAPDFYVTSNRHLSSSRTSDQDDVPLQRDSMNNSLSLNHDQSWSPISSKTTESKPVNVYLCAPDSQRPLNLVTIAEKETETPARKKPTDSKKQEHDDDEKEDDLAHLFSPSTLGNARMIATASTPSALRVPARAATPFSAAGPSIALTCGSGVVRRQIELFNRLSMSSDILGRNRE